MEDIRFFLFSLFVIAIMLPFLFPRHTDQSVAIERKRKKSKWIMVTFYCLYYRIERLHTTLFRIFCTLRAFLSQTHTHTDTHKQRIYACNCIVTWVSVWIWRWLHVYNVNNGKAIENIFKFRQPNAREWARACVANANLRRIYIHTFHFNHLRVFKGSLCAVLIRPCVGVFAMQHKLMAQKNIVPKRNILTFTSTYSHIHMPIHLHNLVSTE